MPDRELRRMRRAELVEIILALKQTEDRLRAENAALSAQLQERQIHIENAGSIAQAALELNKVFEAAQAAADEYVASVRAANKNTDAAAHALRAQAEAEAEQIYVADVTSNGETTRQYLRTDKAGRNGTVSVKTFELGDAE